jgi:hypothetical protein
MSSDPTPPASAGPDRAGGRGVLVVGSLAEAEKVLDRLEREGVAGAELVILGNDRFAVRWSPGE